MKITLELAKAHLRLPSDYTEDDALLAAYIAAAEDRVAEYLCREVDDIAPGGEWPDGVGMAVLLLIGQHYDHRSNVETVRTYEVDGGVARLLNHYRDYSR